ncbi:hypothetical protein [Ralstonia condita]|uniref:hypothetical protein n=1 Tax=Ralstonia condita TaxID=3058600 RepID=UPI00292F50FC|nr:hypothetical protein [Ralstonia sp. LMG 7141]
MGSDIEGTMARLDRDGLILGMANSVVQSLSRYLGLHQKTCCIEASALNIWRGSMARDADGHRMRGGVAAYGDDTA